MAVTDVPEAYYSESFYYTGLYYYGTIAMDYACADYNSDNCVPDFIWFNAYYSLNSSSDGVLGLMPD